jgi:RNAse (barnase) inhibitor barstar
MTPELPDPSARPSDADSLVDTLTAAGWRVAPVGGIASTAELYDQLVAALELPGHFGRNLDALWDSLTDLERPTALLVRDWSGYAAAHPDRWSRVVQVFVDRAAVAPPFLFVLWPDPPRPASR